MRDCFPPLAALFKFKPLFIFVGDRFPSIFLLSVGYLFCFAYNHLKWGLLWIVLTWVVKLVVICDCTSLTHFLTPLLIQNAPPLNIFTLDAFFLNQILWCNTRCEDIVDQTPGHLRRLLPHLKPLLLAQDGITNKAESLTSVVSTCPFL